MINMSVALNNIRTDSLPADWFANRLNPYVVKQRSNNDPPTKSIWNLREARKYHNWL